MFCTEYPYLHSPKGSLRYDYIVSLSYYFDSRKIVCIMREKVLMKNKHLLLVWEEVSTTGRNICKKLRRFMWAFFCNICINGFRSVSHQDIILVNKFYIMSLQDIIRINIFYKNIVAVRDWCTPNTNSPPPPDFDFACSCILLFAWIDSARIQFLEYTPT